MAVPGVPDVKIQAEPLRPTFGHPGLLAAGHVTDVVVLDPRQVPDQPCDRVGLGAFPEPELVGVEAVEDLEDDLADPAERVEKNLVGIQLPAPFCVRR